MQTKAELPEQAHAMEMGKRCVCFLTRKAARCITQYYDGALKPTGLRSTQLALLTTLNILGAVSIKRMARAVVMDRSALARNLKPLEREGLIRIESGRDLRERRVSLTQKGLEKWAAAFPLWESAQAQVEERLGQEGVGTLFSGLSELVSLAKGK